MKASDLMVGDWIEDGFKKAQVTSITCDGIVETTSAISNIEVVDPIPLTEEILAKNGFEKGRDDDVTTFKYGNLFLFYYPDGTGLYNYNSQIIINYVHQLQHLLRLVGVQKEIEL